MIIKTKYCSTLENIDDTLHPTGQNSQLRFDYLQKNKEAHYLISKQISLFLIHDKIIHIIKIMSLYGSLSVKL